MVHKLVSHYYLPLLSLCLISISVSAEESILLIDNTRGIDNTRPPILEELDSINESLESLQLDNENKSEQDVLTEQDTDVEIESKQEQVEVDSEIDTLTDTEVESYTEIEYTTGTSPSPDNSQPSVQKQPSTSESLNSTEPLTTDGNSTILIDNARGIDNTSPNGTDESLDNIETDMIDKPEQATTTEIETDVEPEYELDQKLDLEAQIGTESEFTPDTKLNPLPTDGDSILLIDNTRGIDKIDEIITPLIDKNIAEENSEKEIVEIDSKPNAEEITSTLPKETLDKTTSTTTEAPALPAPPKTKENTIKTTSVQDQEAVDNKTWIPKDSDLRILEIRVETYSFDEVIGAYQYKDIILIPLNAFVSILDIAIDVKTNFAKGFIIKEKNTFALDTLRNEVILKGIAKPYNGELVKVLDNDIFVESNLLSDWLDMKLNVDLFSSRVVVKSETKLPFLARIDREKRMIQALSRINKIEEEYPRHHETYKNYNPPFIDQTFRLAHRVSDAGDVTTFNSTTYATADLFQHESTWYLTLDDQNDVDDFRVTFGRTDPEGGLLDPINAKEYKFGHVTEPRVGLINSTGNLNYGVTVSNHPIGQQTEYDRHRFIGELLPGWEVELYQNNALIGYQQKAVNGQYDFKDVPLLFGNNHFRLAFYGPKGEIKEETKNFQLTHALTQQGKHYYRLSTITDDDGELRTVAQLDYGINKNISSTFDAVSIPLNESGTIVQHNYLGAGLIGYWDALLASTTFISDSENGSALEIDLQTRIDETVISINDIHLNQFFSEEFLPSTTEVTRRSSLDINTAIPPSFLPRIPVTFGFKRDKYVTGDELLEITNQLSMSVHGTAITNQLTHQKATNQQATSNGNLQISTNIDNIRLRSTIGYTLKPINELSNIALTLDPGQYKDYRFSFGVNQSIQQDLTEISATANKLSGEYGLSFGVRYDSNSELNLDVTFSMGFGYEPRRESWHQASSNLANQGSVSARFFLDSNKDGIFNDGDTPVEDIGVRVNSGYNKERSDKDGILFLTGLPAHDPANIIIASGTLSDPLWTPALDGVRIVPRPGHAIEIDFPIFTTGEIDGTVELVKNGRHIGVGSVTVELVDQKGHVISTTETAYDGFYILSHIPMGDYRVRISKTQLDKLDLISPKDERITINGDEPFINGIDFILKTAR